ncbi:MAG: DUF423 domain-containing protein [Winogradskyella sp.]|uniref:DUF423 domain-containing protein n=1 Tax=Winogradskyella sp. TaxID=1883156 RepID=UPI0017FFF767|nr:DUF423 domain-containing protein [Winogradskyella sp.]MBT8243996.1 DUF423 domain-containing protein [Winogradskyella sp.]NNK23801.1 DUF423 domain-containing protein [Winogradskyella sp.]
MNKKLLLTGSIFGIFAIILGAFAAHGLEKLVDENSIKSFETGVRYQMYHAFLLLILGRSSFLPEKVKSRIWILTIVGIFFFSFSIYALATNSLTSFNFKTIAFITPIGGLILILAWVLMLITILKTKTD